MWRGPERRRAERSALSIPIVVRRERPVLVYTSVTRDLGADGLACALPKSLERDAALRLSMDLGDGGPAVECRGKVMWSIPRQSSEENVPVADTGIALEGMSSRDQQRLRRRLAAVQGNRPARRRVRSHAR